MPQSYTTTSYELVQCDPVAFKFESVKSSIQRAIVEKKYEEEKDERLEERKKEMEQLKADNPHLLIDEETYLMAFEEEDVILPEIYIPEFPNEILVAKYGTNENIWLFVAGFDAGYIYEYPRPLSGKIKDNKPVRSRIIEAAQDTEIQNFLFYKNKMYLFLTTQYGELYVCKMKDEDPLNFSDYWILPIHDYYNGHISKMVLSYDQKMLLTCGHDGNIFSFTINDDTSSESIHIPEAQDPLPLPKNIEDIEDADYPSLEEVITRKEQDRIVSATEKKKREILCDIRILAVEYVKIMNRNNNLLPSQQISQFVLDPRIVKDLEQYLKSQIDLMQEKLEFKVEKSKLELQKLMEHFIAPITCLPFTVYGILNEDRGVYSVRELELNLDNISKHITTIRHLEEQRKTGRVVVQKIEEEKEETEEVEMEYFEGFLAEDYSDLSSGLGLQIKQMLSKYKEQKARLIERKKEWKAIHDRKPNLDKNRLEDTAFLENTKKTIGEFNLKMSTGFNLTMKKITAVSKYKQLLDCRSKLHHLRETFNLKLAAVRYEKQRLQKEVIGLMATLKRIHTEIPIKNIKPIPEPPKLNFDIEFPEHNLEIQKYTSMSEKVQEVRRRRQSVIIDKPLDSFDLEYEVLLCDDKTDFGDEMGSLSTLVSSSKMKIRDHLPVQSDLIRTLNTSDSVQTVWEREMKSSRIWRKIYEQDCILRYIDSSYKNLEKELDELEEYRLDVVYQSTYINLNMLTLYEEFIVLRKCEAAERTLEEKVNKKSNESATMTLKIQATNIKIATREEEIRKLHIKIKDVATEYGKAIADNKFHDFLQKIFRKKYTATRERNGSLDSVTQSSETSSDETGSIVDSETEHILFDENICPPGCDHNLYSMAFSAREKRYTYEFQIREEQKQIELLQKELELDTKHLRIIESILGKNQKDLDAFMVEKQKKLNNVDVTVILKIHQLQHISDSGYTAEIPNCVVFNKKKLSNLYTRVGELQGETYDLKEKRKNDEAHLKRIKLDLKYMETQNKKLEEEIETKMIQKFGRKLPLISLYETVLQRLIYNTKTDAGKIMKNFTDEIKSVKRNCNDGLTVLENLIRSNTEKVSLLTVLEKEKFKLCKMLERVSSSKETMLQIDLEHRADIVMLESIVRSQMQQKHLLEYDIENLKPGLRKLAPICLKKSM